MSSENDDKKIIMNKKYVDSIKEMKKMFDSLENVNNGINFDQYLNIEYEKFYKNKNNKGNYSYFINMIKEFAYFIQGIINNLYDITNMDKNELIKYNFNELIINHIRELNNTLELLGSKIAHTNIVANSYLYNQYKDLKEIAYKLNMIIFEPFISLNGKVLTMNEFANMKNGGSKKKVTKSKKPKKITKKKKVTKSKKPKKITKKVIRRKK